MPTACFDQGADEVTTFCTRQSSNQALDGVQVNRFDRNGTARWLTETLRTQAQVLAAASTITLPTLFLVAGDERLVSTEATRRFHDGLSATDISLIEYPNLRHELFNEVEREKVFADLVSWLRSHASVT